MNARRWARAGIGALLALAAAQALAAVPAKGSDFDRTFDVRGQTAHAHFVASYVTGGQTHRLEVWRDGDSRLRRRTDDRIEIYLAKPAGDSEWRMTMLDLKRRIRTDVDRSALIRVGHFGDWFGLAHGIAHPVGAHALAPVAAPAHVAAPIAACRWYRLTQGDRSSKVCWSRAHGLALVITDGDDRLRWRVTALDAAPPAADVFVVDDRGFVRNDANADIRAD